MSKKILFNFATRSRAEKFFACLDNIRLLTEDKNYVVLVKIDHADKSDYTRLVDYPEVIVKRGYSRNKIHAINRDITEDFDILCNHSDDMWFTKMGFDNIIREAFSEPDLFIHFHDGTAPISTYSMMDKAYFDRFGYVYHPDYNSLWCDNEAHEVAVILGRYKFVDEKILEHRHPMNGWGKPDFLLKNTERFYYVDQKIYVRRKAANFNL